MVAVLLLGNREFRLRRLIHNAYLHAINHAEHYILIEHAYFIPDIDIRCAMAQAVRRGVKVTVVLTRDSDVRAAAYASRSLYSSLLSMGGLLLLHLDVQRHAGMRGEQLVERRDADAAAAPRMARRRRS